MAWKPINKLSAHRTHGMSKSPLWFRWMNMKARCRNKNSDAFKNYGARGIKVCDRWLSFENFYSDMGLPPRPGLTIERIDNSKGYEPGNCSWVSRKEQSRNQRRTFLITSIGETRCAKDWAYPGLSRNTIIRRMRSGWNPNEAVSVPARITGLRCRTVEA